MSANRFLIEDKSKLLRTKLERLAVNLSGGLGNESLQTQEAYIFETIRIIREFYKDLQEPQLDIDVIEQVREDDIPDAELYNKIWNQVLDDLITIFVELENIEDITVANFNFITTEANRLTARLKTVDSKLGDYILYSLSPSQDIFFFKDSFNDLSKVDINSSLLNAPECDINQAEGIVTLPLDTTQESFIVIQETPIINPNSNGVVGNNQQIGAPFNGNLSVLLDNNPDTWFEYERVVLQSADNKEPLILDLTINLGKEVVVNHVRVNPNNFGTKTVIEIDEIETSIDGQVYTSIKDDIPIAGFSTQDEENIFALAPSTSKFAGQGLYTFTPRKIKYMRFVFRQTEPYVINTPAGERLRYAIGIRDIDIHSFGYQPIGEVVSNPFESTREIRKVLLDTNQNPSEQSELANIEYYVSPNNGASWHRLQPREFNGATGVNAVPEVLNFNTGDPDQIITPVPVNAIRLKAIFKRDDTKFTKGTSSLNKRILTTAELHVVPEASPFTLQLERNPVDQTVNVIDPMFGSRGDPEAQYILGHASDRLDNRKYRLPLKRFPRPVKKVLNGNSYQLENVPASEYVHLEVGGEEWSHATAPLNTYTIDFDNLDNYKLFVFNPNNGIVEFGDSLTNTLGPTDNQPVTMYFDAERLFPSEITDDHVALLEFPTSSNKTAFTIKRYDPDKTQTETFPRKATVIRLKHQNITGFTDIARALQNQGMDASPKTFLNGRDELIDAGDWSIDTEEGIVYTFTPTLATEDASATYSYQPITVLTVDDWDWATTDLLRDSISIKESAWVTNEVTETLPSTQNIKVLDLSKLSIVKGSLSLSVTVSGIELNTSDPNHPFLKEVDYIDGVQELGGEYLQTTESIHSNIVPIANIATFDLKENISTLTTDHPVFFSNTNLFNTEVGGTPASPGEYSIDRNSGSGTYGQVKFYTTSTVSKPGTITYYYISPLFASNGLYSVNYAHGRIHTQRPINPDNNGSYAIEATFQYTDYRAEYRIARQLDLDSFEVDVTNQTVTILDKEVLKHLQIPRSSLGNKPPLYMVNYDYIAESREDIADLRTRFTPVLKDYALRVITKGKII